MPISLRTVPLDLVFILAGVTCFVGAGMGYAAEGTEIVAAAILLGYLCVLTLRARGSRVLTVFLLFALSYPVVFLGAKYLGVPYHYLVRFQDPGLETTLFSLAILFFGTLFFGVASQDIRLPARIEVESRYLFLLGIWGTVAMLLIGLAVAWPPVTTPYSVESRSSSIFEYAVVPAVLAALTAKGRPQVLLLALVILAGLAVPLLFQRRAVSVIFLLILIFRFFKDTRSPLLLLAGLAAAFLAYRAFAVWRADLELNVLTLLGTHTSATFGLSNHQGGVILSAVTYVGLVEEGLWDGYFRLRSLLGTLFVPYTPLSLNPFPEVFLHLEALKLASIPRSGGFPFVFLYVWGGVGLVLAGAFLLRWLMFNRHASPELIYAKVLILVTFPRWYAYSLPVGIKLLVLGIIFAFAIFALRERRAA